MFRAAHAIYYPFGEGPHVCIGNNFALMEMQIDPGNGASTIPLAAGSESSIAFKPEATLRPKYGMKMTVETV